MTMTVHVLHAGDGYTYLTNQVASGDEVRARGEGLTDYYAASGNPPGRWVGAGCAGLGVEGVVAETQMKALFGEGRHPRTDEIVARMIAEGASPEAALAATQLGQKMRVYANETDHFDKWVDAAFRRFEKQHGRLPERGVEADLVRHDVAAKWLAKNQPGMTVDEAAVRKFFAERGAATRQAVSGYDLVFTPAKSVSVVWGLADRETSRKIEAAHEKAWRGALAWLEGEAAVTRKGRHGITQIDAAGFAAAAFDHIDSRAGDPNLHTHVAVANRVQGVDGKWRALDARPLHHFAVAASERYNFYLEQELTAILGVRFEDVYTRRGGQPVREIVGVPAELREAFSQRSAAIKDELAARVAAYKARHGVMPGKSTQIRLAQEATLATRHAKEAGVTLLGRREQWRARGTAVVGSGERLDQVIAGVVASPGDGGGVLPAAAADALARTVVGNLSAKRSRWNKAHVSAEATRVLRRHLAGSHGRGGLVDADGALEAITELAYNRNSISLEAPELLERPALLSRADGESQFRSHGAHWRTSEHVLARENTLLTAARSYGGPVFDPANVDLVSTLSLQPLDDGQLTVARRFTSSGRLLDAALGPAGTGKTTAMRAFARAVEVGGGHVIALAPSAAAAKVLGDELGVRAETVEKFLVTQRKFAENDAAKRARVEQLQAQGQPVGRDALRPRPHPLRVDAGTIVLIDEAGMTDAGDIAEAVTYASGAGGSVRIIGDPAQLDAVTGAGALRLIDREIGAARLWTVHRFSDPIERDTTLALRDGDVRAAEFYVGEGRLFGGTHEEVLDRIYQAWKADSDAGVNTVMIAHTNDDVRTLAQRAQGDRVAVGAVELTDVQLHNGSLLGVGDQVVTRLNQRENTTSDGGFVKNGDVWTVDKVDRHGRAHVTHVDTGARTTLARQYVSEHVELAYAATIHRVQGRTVDHGHVLMDENTTREQLYVALTRGRDANYIYVVTDPVADVDGHSPVPTSEAPAALLRSAIAREGAELSATETFQREIESHESLDTMLSQYEHVQAVHARPVDYTHAEQVVMAAYGGHGHYVADDDVWSQVARVVDSWEQTGVDPVHRLREIAEPWELAKEPSPGRLVLERAGEIGPGRRVDVAELNPWLAGMEDRIRTRLATNDLVNVPRGRELSEIRKAWGVAPPVAPAPEAGGPTASLSERAGALTRRGVPEPGASPAAAGLAARAAALGGRKGSILSAAEKAAQAAEELERKDGPAIQP